MKFLAFRKVQFAQKSWNPHFWDLLIYKVGFLFVKMECSGSFNTIPSYHSIPIYTYMCVNAMVEGIQPKSYPFLFRVLFFLNCMLLFH